jgi:hypothetical protein
MLKKILIIMLVSIVTPIFANIGDNPGYQFISQKDYDYRFSDNENTAIWRFIIVPDFNKKYKQIKSTNDPATILAMFSFMLKKNKEERMKEYIFNCDTSLNINYLIKGLFYFSQQNYSQSINYLKQFNGDEYIFLKNLLIADCKYELLTDKGNYQFAIEIYQVVLDGTDNQQNKRIVNNRIRYIRYRR